jgi:P27 family predicted phage terminase small subunit
MSKKKSVEQKKQEGTYRADRDTGVKIEALDKMPAPDPKLNLSKEAKGLWYTYGNQLIYNGLMTFLDLVTFGRYCKLYDTALAMHKDIDDNGPFQRTQSGYEQVRPCVGLLSNCESEMLKIEDRFGLSPVSRTKVTVKKQDEENDLTKILNG